MYKELVIVLDPGHGGRDRSNRGSLGYIEADMMLTLAVKLKTKLEKMGYLKVFLTRDGDYDVDVRARGEIAASWGAFLFISLHSNATGIVGLNKSGVEVYESVDLDDELLARRMAESIAITMGIPSLGSKSWQSTAFPGEDYLGVIDAAQDGGVPHVLLIESGFHDNKNDELILLTPGMLDKMADSIANTIECFMSGKMEDTNMGIRNLQFGNSGEDVKDLQYKLSALGYSLSMEIAVTSFGPLTRNAVKHFQKSSGLLEDGIVGPLTMGKITDMIARQTPTNIINWEAKFKESDAMYKKLKEDIMFLISKNV